jgi:hypothetical protein
MIIKYARVCDITNEGMNEGWVWGDGVFYAKYEEDTVKELREEFESSIGVQTDDELLEWAYNKGTLYYTEWEDEDDFQYEEINGILKEL